ncbi:hypothetical protein F5X99DRAFT_336148 [Biscogniauxia marginata]|nr:hypothetical protein F5X99DRAFT_336148 [Biscogniauxia marginata]
MSPDVRIQVYTSPPAYLSGLLAAQLPRSLPLLRRLQFTRFPGGITPHARVLVATSSTPSSLSSPPPSHSSSSSPPPSSAPVVSEDHFAAAYVDLSRGPETQVWLYSSLEHYHHQQRCSTGEKNEEEEEEEEGKEGEEEAERDAESTAQILALLREVKRLRDTTEGEVGNNDDDDDDDGNDTVLVGTLSSLLRDRLRTSGVVFPFADREEVYDKWLFRERDLPDAAAAVVNEERLKGRGGGVGWRWDKVRREDIAFMLSRTHIPRRERTIKLLPSTAIYLDDGTPIAWGFLGPDSSLSSLHCEEPYRGRGLAKAVAVKLLRDHLKDYGDEGIGWADVSPNNPASQRVCKSLGGKVGWQIFWSRIDLN